MREATPKTIYLKDYSPPPFLIDRIELAVDIRAADALVTSRLAVRRIPATPGTGPLLLDGDELELLAVALDRRKLAAGEYPATPERLVVPEVPNAFALETVSRIVPQKNTKRYAMIAATQVAENRQLDLIGRYGIDTVQSCVAVMQQRTERAVRACIEKMPDGSYYGESSTDDDGYELDVPVTVRCRVTVKGGRLTLDFSASDKQRRAFVNCSYPSTYSIGVAGAILFLDPALADYHNEGTMESIEVIAPEGLVVNAKYPAPMGGAPVNMGHNIMEAVMMAMSEAVPSRAAAGWGRRYGQYIYGTNPERT